MLDDEPNITRTWALILSNTGYEATPFTDPQDALAAIRLDPPDVLLSDVGLPGMSGIDVAIALVQENIRTVVVLMSGQAATQNSLDEAIERGYSFEVLAKPVGPAKLLQLIHSLAAAQEPPLCPRAPAT